MRYQKCQGHVALSVKYWTAFFCNFADNSNRNKHPQIDIIFGVNIYKGLHCKDILGMHNKPSSWWGKWCLHEDFNWMFTLVSYVFLVEWIGVKVWAMSYHWSTMVIVSSQSQWVFCRPKDLQSQILRQQLLCSLDYDWVICFRCN